jgi:hypothetical protein
MAALSSRFGNGGQSLYTFPDQPMTDHERRRHSPYYYRGPCVRVLCGTNVASAESAPREHQRTRTPSPQRVLIMRTPIYLLTAC